MQPLDRTLRRQLENTVKEARDVAEAAARAAVDHLGVAEGKPPGHLAPAEKELRRRLRTHGRQLGDQRHGKAETQETDRLIEEVAYEHWHRMLFARFLAENNLLMYPDPEEPVAVTLAECEELAAEEGAKNGWDLAARFAAKMLPQIFRPDSPVFELVLPPERQQQLESLLAGLPKGVFEASDSLGWVYQFWQAKRKDEVNASEVKIGARELPAVTQLFTEPYMVAFLLDNTLGAWWAGQRLTEDDFRTAKSEDELRQKASLPEMPLEYLRFVQEDGVWRPASGAFPGWPKNLAELTVLDPCCGSGHFLVTALPMLASMRMAKDGLSLREAIDATLCENLHGLEIDERCCQIAAFALAFDAWKRSGHRILPGMHIACCGIGPQCSDEEWLKLADQSGIQMSSIAREPIKEALTNLHRLFSQAPILGSLIDPTELPTDMFAADYETTRPYLEAILTKEHSDEVIRERAVAAEGMTKAVTLLARDYTLIVTNVPYLGSRKQSDVLLDYGIEKCPSAKSDLGVIFLDRCLNLVCDNGSAAVVMSQYWLFKSSYEDFRDEKLRLTRWDILGRLGPRAFETISGEVVNVCAGCWSKTSPTSNHLIPGIDAVHHDTPDAKSVALRSANILQVPQHEQLLNPGSRIVLGEIENASLLEDLVVVPQGVKTGDDERWRRRFWELSQIDNGWLCYQSTVSSHIAFGGRSLVLDWRTHGNGMVRPRVKNVAVGQVGVAISQSGNLAATLYTGERFDSNVAPIVPHDVTLVAALWAFCTSPEYLRSVRAIDQSLKVTNTPLVQIPFDEELWRAKVQDSAVPPEPESDDSTQWIFYGSPVESGAPLQVAVARLLGYRWPAELDKQMRLSERARQLVQRCDELLPLADKDGIVCIPAVRGERSAADRLVDLLAKAYGSAWTPAKLNELLKAVGHEGKSLESWLRDKFFEQHCQLFHQRPFIWHIWDGLRDGFSVLVNYHKLDRRNLETLIYTYLGDWITRQKQDQAHGVDGAEERIAAAENLKRKLELILAGEAPHDIFVRWKPLAEQPIGWEPDLNDGVRLNIRPFMSVPDVKARGAGVLRVKPKIDWKKDRGKDVESAPWYSLGPQYGGKEGDRINDHHLTLAEKIAAREAQKG